MVKVLFQQIARFFAGLWNSLFANDSCFKSKEIAIPKSEQEIAKIAQAVEEILSGGCAQFTDSKTPNVWEIPSALYPDVVRQLANKGFGQSKLKTATHASGEGKIGFAASFDACKLTDAEIVGLAVEALKRGREVYFHFWHGAEGCCLFLLKHVEEVEKKLQREGYAAFSEKHYDYASDLDFGVEDGGYLNGVTLIAKIASHGL